MKKRTLQEQCLLELHKLDEATRTQLVAQSRNVGQYKDTSRGKTRFDRKKYSKVANAVKSYNEINMNDFWKSDILKVNIPVVGETDEYIVTIKLEGVVAELQKNVKNNQNKFEFKTIIQALTKVFNTTDVWVKCSCADFKYRFAHHLIIHNMSVDDSSQDPGPGKGIANPNDDKGRGCKHILLCLSNGSWMMKVASVVFQYALYMDEHKHDVFKKLIFPKIYGMPAEEAADNNLVADEEALESSKSLIAAINDWSKNKGKFKKGSNINPVYADKLSKEGGQKKAEEKVDKSAEENNEPSEETEDKNNIV